MKLHRGDRGIKGVELGMGLLSIGILAAMAISLMVNDHVDNIVAAAEIRAAEVEDAAVGRNAGADVQVAGVWLERAADGSTCLWSLSASGAFSGVFQSGTLSRYGTFETRPDLCPVAAEAEAAGFSASQP
jgi:hypothetical protein